MYETIEISEEEASFRRNMDRLFGRMRSLERENEKLAVDSVALDKIIKIMRAWRTCYAPDRAHITLDEISDIIDERGDLNVS